MEYKVKHMPDRSRFETQVDGHTGYVEYVPGAGLINITHTIVPPAIEGRGVASSLVQAVHDHARENGMKVSATCYYAVLWARRHPEYSDTIA